MKINQLVSNEIDQFDDAFKEMNLDNAEAIKKVLKNIRAPKRVPVSEKHIEILSEILQEKENVSKKELMDAFLSLYGYTLDDIQRLNYAIAIHKNLCTLAPSVEFKVKENKNSVVLSKDLNDWELKIKFFYSAKDTSDLLQISLKNKNYFDPKASFDITQVLQSPEFNQLLQVETKSSFLIFDNELKKGKKYISWKFKDIPSSTDNLYNDFLELLSEHKEMKKYRPEELFKMLCLSMKSKSKAKYRLPGKKSKKALNDFKIEIGIESFKKRNSSNFRYRVKCQEFE